MNTKRESVICEMPFPGPILRVRLNRERMAVVLADEIHVYDMANMKLIKVRAGGGGECGAWNSGSEGTRGGRRGGDQSARASLWWRVSFKKSG